MADATLPDPLEPLVGRPGAHRVPFHGAPAHPDRPVLLWSACPEGYSEETPILFAHHGMKRSGQTSRDSWTPFAREFGWLVIAPEFSNAHYPGARWYNHGNVVDDQGHPHPREQWTLAIDAAVFAGLRRQRLTRRPTYSLFGHSAGAQFVHRMLTCTGTGRVEAAIAANAGRYTLPLLDEAFPYGVRGLGLTPAHIAGLLGFPLSILIGEADVETAGADFPTSPDAMRQGPTRVARGQFYFETGRRVAREMGVPFRWALTPVPGVAHEAQRMAAVAGPLLAALVRTSTAGASPQQPEREGQA